MSVLQDIVQCSVSSQTLHCLLPPALPPGVEDTRPPVAGDRCGLRAGHAPTLQHRAQDTAILTVPLRFHWTRDPRSPCSTTCWSSSPPSLSARAARLEKGPYTTVSGNSNWLFEQMYKIKPCAGSVPATVLTRKIVLLFLPWQRTPVALSFKQTDRQTQIHCDLKKLNLVYIKIKWV